MIREVLGGNDCGKGSDLYQMLCWSFILGENGNLLCNKYPQLTMGTCSVNVQSSLEKTNNVFNTWTTFVNSCLFKDTIEKFWVRLNVFKLVVQSKPNSSLKTQKLRCQITKKICLPNKKILPPNQNEICPPNKTGCVSPKDCFFFTFRVTFLETVYKC